MLFDQTSCVWSHTWAMGPPSYDQNSCVRTQKAAADCSTMSSRSVIGIAGMSVILVLLLAMAMAILCRSHSRFRQSLDRSQRRLLLQQRLQQHERLQEESASSTATAVMSPFPREPAARSCVIVMLAGEKNSLAFGQPSSLNLIPTTSPKIGL